MQAPTHLITGILIQQTITREQPITLQRFLVIAFAGIFSHGILDELAVLTYHPPASLAQDWFWISYHSIIGLLTIAILAKHWKKYSIGLIFSVFPDLDWIMIFLSKCFSLQIPFWRDKLVHQFLFHILDPLPPSSLLCHFPKCNLARQNVLPELALLGILSISILATSNQWGNIRLVSRVQVGRIYQRLYDFL